MEDEGECPVQKAIQRRSASTSDAPQGLRRMSGAQPRQDGGAVLNHYDESARWSVRRRGACPVRRQLSCTCRQSLNDKRARSPPLRSLRRCNRRNEGSALLRSPRSLKRINCAHGDHLQESWSRMSIQTWPGSDRLPCSNPRRIRLPEWKKSLSSCCP